MLFLALVWRQRGKSGLLFGSMPKQQRDEMTSRLPGLSEALNVWGFPLPTVQVQKDAL